jgi:hypothetical protein
MDTLRAAGIYFEVIINAPEDDPGKDKMDIYRFRNEQDMELINSLIWTALLGFNPSS